MSRSSKPSAKDIRQFMSVTGAKRNVAVSMLEACGGNLELAISMHIENGSDDVTEQPVGAAVASSHSTGRRANGTENGFVTPTVPVDEDGYVNNVICGGRLKSLFFCHKCLCELVNSMLVLWIVCRIFVVPLVMCS